ncbi:MAG: carboxypeptidase regulatory-like domain-containing protein [Bacteroidetes bacterium]|nr:carboxypeptidase regulatory-like domain-containing protein [Bacteroidota bacterium]
MNNSQRAKLDTCNRVKEYLTKFDSELATISELGIEKSAFLSALEAINAAATVQSQTAAAATDAVKNAKEKMAIITIIYAKRAKVKAIQANNTTLVNHLDHPFSYISGASKTLAVHRATEIKNQLNNNLAILTNITTANIDEITDAINAFDSIKEQPVTIIQARSATGTSPLPTAFAVAFKSINNIHELIESYFTLTNKPLVHEFELAKQILSTGIHRTGAEGVVTKDGSPILNATVKVAGTDKVAKTDIDGHYIIANIKVGDYTIEASNENGDKASKIVHISKGSFETVNIAI